jgi:hypothetical protein
MMAMALVLGGGRTKHAHFVQENDCLIDISSDSVMSSIPEANLLDRSKKSHLEGLKSAGEWGSSGEKVEALAGQELHVYVQLKGLKIILSRLTLLTLPSPLDKRKERVLCFSISVPLAAPVFCRANMGQRRL